MRKAYVEYNANNSGGHWWMTDDDWRALEKAGWKVVWASLAHVYSESGEYVFDSDGMPKLIPVDQSKDRFARAFTREENGEYRYMGAIARGAYRSGLPLRDAAREFDTVTSQHSTDAGCPCCGNPHNFTEYDDTGKWKDSGPKSSYTAEW